MDVLSLWDRMKVKHIPLMEVHRGVKGGKTECGIDTRINPSHWVGSEQVITCVRCINDKRKKE